MQQRFESQVSTWLSRLDNGAQLFPGKSLSECHGEAQFKHNGVYEVRLPEEGGTAACVYKLSLLTWMSCCDLSGIWIVDDAAGFDKPNSLSDGNVESMR